jgi:hypothetical protein
MKGFRKILKYFAFLIGILLTIILIVGLKYYLIVSNNSLPYRNILDNYGYIYVHIKSQDRSCTIIGNGNLLLNTLSFRDSSDFFDRSSLSRGLVILKTVFKLNSSIHNDKEIEVSDSIYNMFQSGRIDKSKIELFAKKDLIKEGYLVKNKNIYSHYLIKDSINSEDFNTIVYVMLKTKKMDCKRYCESGGTYLEFESKR